MLVWLGPVTKVDNHLKRNVPYHPLKNGALSIFEKAQKFADALGALLRFHAESAIDKSQESIAKTASAQRHRVGKDLPMGPAEGGYWWPSRNHFVEEGPKGINIRPR